MNRNLYSLQGYIRIGKRLANGKCGAAMWAGNVPKASLALGEQHTDKKESYTGNRGKIGRIYTEKTATFSGTFDEWSLRTLGLMLHGASQNTAAGTVTGEEFPPALIVGDQIELDHPYASALVITDSAGAPVTVADTDYTLTGHNDRIVEIVGVGTYTQPFVAAYSYASFDSIDIFGATPEEVYCIFDGIDTEYQEPVIIDMFRVQFDPIKDFALISTEYGSMDFSAELLLDPLNLNASGLGGYARITSKAVA